MSFSEDSHEDLASLEESPRSFTQQQQMQTHYTASQIPFMNYLQVPGQAPNCSFVITPQQQMAVVAAQTSPQARKRRQTRLMKAGSFCSISSEGDGDIFGPTGELLPAQETTNKRSKFRQLSSSLDSASSELYPAATRGNFDSPAIVPAATLSDDGAMLCNPKSFDPLSDYSEFQADDCRSDISDLFSRTSPPEEEEELGEEELRGEQVQRAQDATGGAQLGAAAAAAATAPKSSKKCAYFLQAQGTFSDPGSIRSLSIDQEDVTFEQVGKERFYVLQKLNKS